MAAPQLPRLRPTWAPGGPACTRPGTPPAAAPYPATGMAPLIACEAMLVGWLIVIDDGYRIVVSDLLRRRPIWFGGEDRSEESMALFYDWLGEKKTRAFAWR